MKTICYYHSADLDGISSAAIVYKKYPDAELIGIDYDKFDLDWIKRKCKGNRIIVVDFSLPEMKDLLQLSEDLIWIDHHITAKELNPEMWIAAKGKRDLNNKSACRLTWEFFYPKEPIPLAVLYIEDRDLWKFKYNQTKDFTTYAYMKLKSPTDDLWMLLFTKRIPNNKLGSNDVIKLWIDKGKLLNEAQLDRVKKTFEQGWDGTLNGYKARFMNTNHEQSDCGSYACGEMGYPIAVIFSIDDKKVYVGLRSKTIDVGKIAKERGGGGHKYASGFVIEKNLIGNILK